MKFFFLISFLMFPALAMAQDEGVDPYAECAEVLASPPANELAEMSKEGTYGRLDRMLQPYVLGKTCSVEQITKYMLDAGWELERRGLQNFEAPKEAGRYTFDRVLFFCLPERGFWRLLNRCGGGASFFWLEEQITWLVFVVPLRFGG